MRSCGRAGRTGLIILADKRDAREASWLASPRELVADVGRSLNPRETPLAPRMKGREKEGGKA